MIGVTGSTAGQVLTLALSLGGLPGSTSNTSGFQSYIIVVRNFPSLTASKIQRLWIDGRCNKQPRDCPASIRDATVVVARGQ